MKNENVSKNNKIRVIVFITIIGLVMIIGTSFALWQIVLKQKDTNTITTSCLKVTFTENTDAITLQDAYPISDTDGKKLVPYTFTIENICDASTSYVVNLEVLTTDSGTKILPDKYVKANLLKTNNEVFNDTFSNNYINEQKVIEDAQTAYKLYKGRLNNKSKVTFDLRIWLDDTTPMIDGMEALWQGKITVTAEYVPPVVDKNVMTEMELITPTNRTYVNATYTRNNKYKISTVSFENAINPYNDAALIVDFSLLQDESVLGYYIKDESSDTYTIHIQADGKIKVNKNASFYGTNVTLEGIENLDTSLVVDMSYMFFCCDNTSLDLSTFDTSNVANMSAMFYGSDAKEINFSNFNTSKVTDMSFMFYYADDLTSLDLSMFDTGNVVDMNHMFCHIIGIKNLDLSTFNTENVLNMSWMFGWDSWLVDLNISNFNTSKVTDMSDMFVYDFTLTSIDVSSFDTSSVTVFDGMFMGISSTANIVYSDRFVYTAGASVTRMFDEDKIKRPTHESWNGII